MSPRSRLLTAKIPPPPSSPATQTVNGDFVVILAALLCALVCVLGLVAVARCGWLRRIVGPNSPPLPPPPANKGLKKKVLKSLPKVTYSEVMKLYDCAICLAEFVAGEEIRVLPQCAHGFHVLCIDTWLKSHSSCPTCRHILEAARCKKCGRFPAATCSAAGLQPHPRETYQIWFNPHQSV